MRNFFKNVSIILIISMIMTVLPVNIFAENESDNNDVNTQQLAEQTVQTVQTVQAVESVQSSPQIKGEIIDKRERNIKHFLKDDGTFEAAVYPMTVHYKDSDGQWNDIDNTLAETINEENNDMLENKANDFKVKFARKSDANKLVSIKKDKYEISWGLVGNEVFTPQDSDQNIAIKETTYIAQLNSAPVIYDEAKNVQALDKLSHNDQMKTLSKLSSDIEYKDIYTGVDLQYVLGPEQVKENVILNERLDNPVFTFQLDIKNLIPVYKEDNSIVFYDAENTTKEVFRMQAPFMVDAIGEQSNNVQVVFEEDQKGYTLTLRPDKEWLDSKERVYPVKIDPNLYTSGYLANIRDCEVNTQYPNNTLSTSTNINVGVQNGYIYRGYYSFDLPQLSSSDLVTKADLTIDNSGYYNNQINIHKVNENWDPNTITWNNQPEYDTGIVDYLNTSGSMWNVTKVVKEWYTKGGNYGFLLKLNNESLSEVYRSFKTSEYGNYWGMGYPYMVISYINTSGLEDYWTYHSQDAGRAGQGYINDCTGNVVFINNDLQMTGEKLPITLNHVYNSSNKDTDKGYGLGWRLNYQQVIDFAPHQNDYFSTGSMTCYIDGDGSNTYFKYVGDGILNGYTQQIYRDTAGQNLTLYYGYSATFNNTIYQLVDKYGNNLYFTVFNNGTSYYFRLKMIKDIKGNYFNIFYYNDGRISQMVDGVGRIYYFNYQNYNLTNITAYGNKEINFEYTGSLLTKIIYPDGSYVTYSYDANNNLKEAINNDGYKVTYEYNDASPYLVKKALESNVNGILGNELSINYGQNSNTFTDIQGRTTTYQFNNNGNTVNITDWEGNAQYLRYGKSSEIYAQDRTNKLITQSKIQKSIMNYLKNHNAEADRDWLGAYSGGSLGVSEYTTLEKYMGSRSLKVSKTNNLGSQYLEQQVTLEKGKSYTLSGYIKTSQVSETSGKGAGLSVTYQDGTGAYNAVQSQLINGSKDWQRDEVCFTLPADAISNVVSIKTALVEETGTAYFDCIQLENGITANRYNIVENADFKYGLEIPDFWNKNSACGNEDILTTVVKDVPDMDNRVFKLNGDPVKQKKLTQTLNISGNPGDIFVAGAWAQGSAAPATISGRAYQLEIAFIRSNGTEQKVVIPFSESSTGWQYAADRIITDSSYVSIRYDLVYGNNVNIAYFDGLQLYKEEFGQSYEYDSNGNIVSVTDLSNQKSEFTYNTNNDMTKSMQVRGNDFKINYGSFHNPLDSTTSENVINNYTYSGYDLTASKVVNGALYINESYTYTTDKNYINSIKDPSGNTVNYNYDLTKGLLNSFADSKGKTTTYGYDVMDRLTQVNKTADGQQVLNNYSYENNKLKQITHNNFNYTFDYNSLNNISSIKAGQQPLVTNVYEPRTSKLLETIFGNLQKIGFEYDNLDRLKTKKYNDQTRDTYEYNAEGNLAYHEDLVNNINYKYTYDMAGRLVKAKDSQGNSLDYEYDSDNNSSNFIEKFNNGITHTTLYKNDSDNRPMQTSYYRDNIRSEGMEYFSLNNTTTGSLGTIPQSNKALYEMDENGKKVFISYEKSNNYFYGNPSFENYDAYGKLINWSVDYYAKYSKSSDSINGRYSAELTGDSYGLSSDKCYISYPNDCTISFYVKRLGGVNHELKVNIYNNNNYNFNSLTFTENIPEGQWTKVSYTFSLPSGASYIKLNLNSRGTDSKGTVRYDAVCVEKKSFPTNFSHDFDTNLKYDLGIDKNAGTMTVWFNNKVSNGKVRNILANEATGNGMLNMYIDTNNVLKLRIKDSQGILTDIINTNQVIQTNKWYLGAVSWYLEGSTLNLKLHVNDQDQPGVLHEFTATTTDFKDFTNSTTAVGSDTAGINQLNGWMEQFTYSPNYQPENAAIIFNSGRGTVHEYSYDRIGRFNNIKINTGKQQYQTTLDYLPGFNGSSTYRLGTLNNNGSSISYTYDANGNIETITQSGLTIRYYYNELNEVIRENNQPLNKTIVYTYDVGGNFTSKIEYPYTTGVPANPTKTYSFAYDTVWKDKMTSFDGKAITYDEIGNPLTYDWWTHTWEMGRQLATMSKAGQNLSFKYNDAGIRTEKTNNGVTTKYHLVGGLVTYQDDGTDKMYFTYDAVGKLISMNLNGMEYYYIYNGQGDIIGLFDISGTQVVSYVYDTWGKLISITGTLANTVGVKNPYRYRGYRYDTETGLYYLNSRYYNPEWGRFLNADDISYGIPGVLLTYNLFAYCLNNPVNFDDPNGTIIPVILFLIATAPEWVPWVCIGTAAVLSAFTAKAIIDNSGSKSSTGFSSSTPANPDPNDDKNGLKNKLNHIFGKKEHNLDGFLNKYGGNQVKAYNSIQNATQQYVNSNSITGIFKDIVVNVDGVSITVRGNVIDGVVKIATAFIP